MAPQVVDKARIDCIHLKTSMYLLYINPGRKAGMSVSKNVKSKACCMLGRNNRAIVPKRRKRKKNMGSFRSLPLFVTNHLDAPPSIFFSTAQYLTNGTISRLARHEEVVTIPPAFHACMPPPTHIIRTRDPMLSIAFGIPPLPPSSYL
jgi:hypothetical protein